MHIEPLGTTRADLGESPVWDAEGQALLWVDIPRGHLHRTDVRTGRTRTVELKPPLSLVLHGRGEQLLVALGRTLARLDERSETLDPLLTLDVEEGIRFNDGTYDPQGRLLVGTMLIDKNRRASERPCALYRVEPGKQPVPVIQGVSLANGVDFAPDGTRLYFIDTPMRRIDVLDVSADGEMSRRRPFAQIESGAGNPDGLTVDAEGGVWVALFGGGTVRRYDRTGRPTQSISLPVRYPTSCCFGGTDLDELFVTTARIPVPEPQRAREPLAGAVLCMRPGLRGLRSRTSCRL